MQPSTASRASWSAGAANIGPQNCSEKDVRGRFTLKATQVWSLYALHSLTSLNNRIYEFAAIVFTASLYPNTLLAASVRGATTTIACVCLSSALGRWIDGTPSRLRGVTWSVWVQQSFTVSAYLFWLFLVGSGHASDEKDAQTSGTHSANNTAYQAATPVSTHVVFGIIVLLGIIIKLGSITNEMTVDRNWLPLLAPSSMLSSRASRYDLTYLNAALRRIDLVVKIGSPPLFNSLLSTWTSRRGAVTLLAITCCVSGYIQLRLALRIYHSSPALRAPKNIGTEGINDMTVTKMEQYSALIPHQTWSRILHVAKTEWRTLRQYFSTAVWVPSMTWALLHLTVLAYSSSLMTYLLEIGFSLHLVTFAQASASCVELASTLITPWLIHRQDSKTSVVEGMRHLRHIDTNVEEPGIPAEAPRADSSVLEKVGLWGILWQFCNLIPVVAAMFYASYALKESSPARQISLASLTLLTFLSLSRFGYWTFELTTQELTQSLVPTSQRSSFAGTQQSFLSFFELLHWIATAACAKPRYFPWLALGSLSAVGISAGGYAIWVLLRRKQSYMEVGEEEVVELLEQG